MRPPGTIASRGAASWPWAGFVADAALLSVRDEPSGLLLWKIELSFPVSLISMLHHVADDQTYD
jgi:hypothetical protein